MHCSAAVPHPCQERCRSRWSGVEWTRGCISRTPTRCTAASRANSSATPRRWSGTPQWGITRLFRIPLRLPLVHLPKSATNGTDRTSRTQASFEPGAPRAGGLPFAPSVFSPMTSFTLRRARSARRSCRDGMEDGGYSRTTCSICGDRFGADTYLQLSVRRVWNLQSYGVFVVGGWPGRHSILGFDVRIVDQHPILAIH